jgi:hypothetical protein
VRRRLDRGASSLKWRWSSLAAHGSAVMDSGPRRLEGKNGPTLRSRLRFEKEAEASVLEPFRSSGTPRARRRSKRCSRRRWRRTRRSAGRHSRAHAGSGDTVTISSYFGTGDAFRSGARGFRRDLRRPERPRLRSAEGRSRLRPDGGASGAAAAYRAIVVRSIRVRRALRWPRLPPACAAGLGTASVRRGSTSPRA